MQEKTGTQSMLHAWMQMYKGQREGMENNILVWLPREAQSPQIAHLVKNT